MNCLTLGLDICGFAEMWSKRTQVLLLVFNISDFLCHIKQANTSTEPSIELVLLLAIQM